MPSDICTYQIELWEDCPNHCSFCYNGNCKPSTVEEKIKAISFARHKLLTLPDKYNAFGLIGGDFFSGQVKDLPIRTHFASLINEIDTYISSGRLKQAWITANLIGETDFFSLLSGFLNKNKLLICTSYDTTGRFHTSNDRDSWFNNVKLVKELGFLTHTQVILTQDFIDEALTTSILQKLTAISSVDFKCPGVSREHLLSANAQTVEQYRSGMDTSNTKFFISDRSRYLKFILLLHREYPAILHNFLSLFLRSDELYLYQTGVTLSNRAHNQEVAPCGHLLDSYCYTCSDKCVRCDAEGLLDA